MTLMKTLYAGLVSVSLALIALPATAQKDDVQIVASFSILGDMVEEVVGELAGVTTIVGPDADAHIYQPSVADARAVAEADVIFVNGLGFETWSDTLITESGTEAVVHVATEGITPIEVDGETDPQAYITELKALDAETRTRLAELPANRRTVVTAHDAFGYLADAYGLTFLAPVGIDTEAEPSARDLAVLIQQLKAEGAAALFVENITSPALVQQISDETGIAIGGRLFSDALSERGGPATSYLAMFQHNLGALLDALGNPTAR